MFSWYEYLVLVAMLIFSTLIGIYFGCFGSKQSTTAEYLFGGQKMKFFPIGLSITASQFSAVTLIGVPSDVYTFGAFYWFICLCQVLIFLLAAGVFYPVFFKAQLTTVYEYLEKRFDKKTRLLGSFLYVLRGNITLPVFIYGPALALSTVTGVKVSVIAFAISFICVFYTAIGGLKTVVWTDVLQLVVIMASTAVITWIGVKSTGGFSTVWNTALAGGRLDIFDFDFDPTKKDSFRLFLIGETIQLFNQANLSQSTVQKILTLLTFRDCVMSLLCQLIGMCLVMTSNVFLGLTIYARYADCDPLSIHKITKNDEIVSYYIMDIAGNIPGLSGLFMAAIVSAAISTISSTLNSLSGVIYKDFISQFSRRQFTEKSAVFILKLIVVIEGVLCTSLVLLIEHLGQIVPLCISLSGIVNGPLLGLFTLGILFPKINAKSAFYGGICGLIFISFIAVPAYYYKYYHLFVYPTKSFSVDGCQLNMSIANTSISLFASNSTTTVTSGTINTTWKPFFLFRISYYYYGLIGAVATITIALIINQLINRNESSAERVLISPV
ncbi:unnamed protein product [Tenebrio molitor]|nr:unnamed protein product [Tenebrio molitor]